MNKRERTYHNWVLVLAGLALFGAGGAWVISISAAVSWGRIILHCTPVTVVALGLTVTAAIHQFKGRIVRPVMICQIVLLFWTVWGIPLGIWGIRLLSASPHSADQVH